MEGEAPIYPPESMAYRLRDCELKTLLHLGSTHPVPLHHQSQRHLGITTGHLPQGLCTRRIQFIDQAQHSEQIGLWHAIFTQCHYLPLA